MAILIIASGWNPNPWVQATKAELPEADIRVWPQCGNKSDIEYIYAWKPPAGILCDFPNLRIIFSLGAGVDHIFASLPLPDNVPVVRVINSDLTARMSEYIVMNILMHHRDILGYQQKRAKKIWHGETQPAAAEVRVGIMGMGVLGQDAAEILVRLGFQVAGWSRSAKTIPGIQTYHGTDRLDAFLARTDHLAVLLPLTPETEGIINYQLLQKLARDGVGRTPTLTNAGRGGLQIEADILRALDDGTLHAASLDVFNEEPLPATSPLWLHERIFLTPHNAADSTPAPIVAQIVQQIKNYEAGEALQNQVNVKDGY